MANKNRKKPRSKRTVRSYSVMIDELAKATGFSPATIKKHLKEVDGSWIRTVPTKNPNVVRFVPLVEGKEIE